MPFRYVSFKKYICLTTLSSVNWLFVGHRYLDVFIPLCLCERLSLPESYLILYTCCFEAMCMLLFRKRINTLTHAGVLLWVMPVFSRKLFELNIINKSITVIPF